MATNSNPTSAKTGKRRRAVTAAAMAVAVAASAGFSSVSTSHTLVSFADAAETKTEKNNIQKSLFDGRNLIYNKNAGNPPPERRGGGDHISTDGNNNGKIDTTNTNAQTNKNKDPSSSTSENASTFAAAKISTISPAEAFTQLMKRTFGHKRVMFTNPSMTASDVMANISFVPTRWTRKGVVADRSNSNNNDGDNDDDNAEVLAASAALPRNKYGHPLTRRVWAGPLRERKVSSSEKNNAKKTGEKKEKEDDKDATETTLIEYQCASPHTLTIYAETAADAGYALHHYLRRYLSSSVEWGVDGTGYNIVIPANGLAERCGSAKSSLISSSSSSSSSSSATKKDAANDTEYIESIGKYRYYYNVCTFGYTSAFWNWDDRWSQEIDWMALHGSNLVLMSLPTEYLWILTLTTAEFGLNASDATSYFTGPAFLPWNRMGNIHSYAGPASVSFFKQQFVLALRIVQRMRDLGINPILPAFDGHVSDAFVAKYKSQYPNDFMRGADWGGMGGGGFSENWILLPSSKLFTQLGVSFMKSVVQYFGMNTYYAADTWNEMAPPDGSPAYLSVCASALLGAIRAVDPSGIWLLQGWTFYNDRHWWSVDRVKSYLSGAPIGQLIVLDLTSDNNPVYPWTSGYFGHYFIWNMLHNYGGKRGIWGAMDVVASTPSEVYLGGQYPSMVGVGTTPEGTETNPVLYSLLFDSAWGVVRSIEQLKTEWLPMFWKARFGAFITSFAPEMPAEFTLPMLELNGAYRYIPPCCSHFVSFEQRPWLTRQPFYQSPLGVNTQYNPDSVVKALYKLLKPLARMTKEEWVRAVNRRDPSLVTYRYEVVDYLRQVMGNIFTDAQFGALAPFFDRKFPYYRFNVDTLSNAKRTIAEASSSSPSSSSSGLKQPVKSVNDTVDETMAFLDRGFGAIMADIEKLVGCDDNNLLGRLMKEAKDLAPTAEEVPFMQFNAIRQISLWGPKEAPAIHDYATKQWDGIISAFYIPRWKLFWEFLGSHIKENGGRFTFPSEDEWAVDSVTAIESPLADDLSNKSSPNYREFSVTPTTSLADSFDVMIAMADKYLPDWRAADGNDNIKTNTTTASVSDWEKDYDVIQNVTVATRPLYTTWTSMAVIQHSVCALIPDCLGFSPNGGGWGNVGGIYAFDLPTYSGGGTSTLYIKKKKE